MNAPVIDEDQESTPRKPRLLKKRRIEIMNALAKEFPFPNSFKAADVLSRFPELQYNENAHGFLMSAVNRNELNKIGFGDFQFAQVATQTVAPVGDDLEMMRSVAQSMENSIRLMHEMAGSFSTSEQYQVGDLLVAKAVFRRDIYGDRFISQPADRCPPCLVIEQHKGPENQRLDLVVMWTDEAGQSHCRPAGSFQFDRHPDSAASGAN